MARKKFNYFLVNYFTRGIVALEMSKKNNEKRYVIVVPETLHYRLRQTALRERSKLTELVERLLWEALKAR